MEGDRARGEKIQSWETVKLTQNGKMRKCLREDGQMEEERKRKEGRISGFLNVIQDGKDLENIMFYQIF